MIELRLKTELTAPLESDGLSPDRLCKLRHSELGGMEIHHGRRRYRLDDFFEIDGEPSHELRLIGNLEKLRWVGKGMSRGSIEVHGNIGMHLGAHMTGGKITVEGNAGDWVGAEMRQGWIHISGEAGNRVGAAYIGSSSGMKNGFICVGGSAGQEVGHRMRRGTIVVGGNVGEFGGLRMKGGTLVLLSGAGERTGAWMNRGTIISFRMLELLPTFQTCGQFTSPFMAVFDRYLRRYSTGLPKSWQSGTFLRSVGDATAAVGKGEILTWHPAS